MRDKTKRGKAVVNSWSLVSWSKAGPTNLVKDTKPHRPKGKVKKTEKDAKQQKPRHNTKVGPVTNVRKQRSPQLTERGKNSHS